MVKIKWKSVVLCLLAGVFAAGVLAYSPKEMAAQAATGGVVLLDPGHIWHLDDQYASGGRSDSGNIAPDGTYESVLNVQLAAKIAQQLQARGITVYTTLDIGVAGVQPLLTSSIPNIKLKMRAAAAAQVKADVFISVHHNSSNSKRVYDTAQGTILLWDSAQQGGMGGKSLEFANKLWGQIRTLGNTAGNRAENVKDQGASVERYNSVPAVTLETAFMTNQADLARAKDPNAQLAMAQKVADGVADFLGAGSSTQDTKAPGKADKVFASASPTKSPKFTVTMAGVRDSSGIKSTYFEVYPKGKAALKQKVKTSKKSADTWAATIDLRKLKMDKRGVYTIVAYATDKAGNTGKVGAVNVRYNKDVKKPVLSKVDVKTPSKKPRFLVTAMNVRDESGVKRVWYEVYLKGQKAQGVKTVKTVNKGSGNWAANVDIKRLFKDWGGIYTVDVYAVDKKGNEGRIGTKNIRYAKRNPAPVVTPEPVASPSPAAPEDPAQVTG